MGIYSDNLEQEVRLERLRPAQNYGLVGIDPRGHASAEVGRENSERLIEYLIEWLDGPS